MNQVELLEWFLPRADLDCVLVAGRYTLLDTRAAATLFPECQRRGVAVLAGGVFNSGVLARPGARTRPTTICPPADASGPGAADRRGLRAARGADRSGRAAVHAAPPGGDRRRCRRAQRRRDRQDAGLPGPVDVLRMDARSTGLPGRPRGPADCRVDRRRAPSRLGSGGPEARLARRAPGAEPPVRRWPTSPGAASRSGSRPASWSRCWRHRGDRGVPGAGRGAGPGRRGGRLDGPDQPGRWRRIARLRGLPGGNRLAGIRHLVQDEPDPDWLRRPEVRRGSAPSATPAWSTTCWSGRPAARRAGRDRRARRRHVRAGPRRQTSGHLPRALEPWASQIGELAARPNVSCKLSGLVTEAGPGWPARRSRRTSTTWSRRSGRGG